MNVLWRWPEDGWVTALPAQMIRQGHEEATEYREEHRDMCLSPRSLHIHKHIKWVKEAPINTALLLKRLQIPTYIDGTKAKTINQRCHQYTAQQTIDWRQGACGCWKTQMTRHLTCGCTICQLPGNHSMTLELQGPCCTSWAEPS